MSLITSKMLKIEFAGHDYMVVNSFNRFYEKENYLDLVFICDKNVQVKAHKMVVAAVSDFVKFIIESVTDDTVFISVPDVCYKNMKLLLNYLYEGVAKLNQDELVELQSLLRLLNIRLPSASVSTCDSVPLSLSNFNNFSESEARTEQPRSKPETSGLNNSNETGFLGTENFLINDNNSSMQPEFVSVPEPEVSSLVSFESEASLEPEIPNVATFKQEMSPMKVKLPSQPVRPQPRQIQQTVNSELVPVSPYTQVQPILQPPGSNQADSSLLQTMLQPAAVVSQPVPAPLPQRQVQLSSQSQTVPVLPQPRQRQPSITSFNAVPISQTQPQLHLPSGPVMPQPVPVVPQQKSVQPVVQTLQPRPRHISPQPAPMRPQHILPSGTASVRMRMPTNTQKSPAYQRQNPPRALPLNAPLSSPQNAPPSLPLETIKNTVENDDDDVIFVSMDTPAPGKDNKNGSDNPGSTSSSENTITGTSCCKTCGKQLKFRKRNVNGVMLSSYEDCEACKQGGVSQSRAPVNETGGRYKCFKCEISFNKREDFLNHVAGHQTDSGRAFRCDDCKKTFNDFRIFRQHLSEHNAMP